MMVLHLVPPQSVDNEPASNQGDSPEPRYNDLYSDRKRNAAFFFPCPSASLAVGADSQDNDSTWMTPEDMAILKVIGAEPCLTASSGQHHRCTKWLPAGTRPVKLVGEGAANAVFEIEIPKRHRTSRDFKGLLLRVAKAPSNGSFPSYNYLQQQKFLESKIKPILGDHIVHQELVVLHKSGIVHQLNNLLRGTNATRKDKFKDTYVAETDWGFLVEDMRPRDPDTCALVEFKPKWLSQSPSAPKNAIRCRQCAMELRNLVKNLSVHRAYPDRKPCPLALLTPERPGRVCSPFRMAPHLAGTGNDAFYLEALSRVAKHAAIHDLKEQQDFHDKLGPLHVSPSDVLFPLAMTLRDCTCFAQIDKSSQNIRIRFGDWDWKDPRVKFDRWRGIEEELIDKGFYTASWIFCGGAFYRSPTLCLLELITTAEKHPAVIQIMDSKCGSTGDDRDEKQLASTFEGANVHKYTTDIDLFQRILDPYRTNAPNFRQLRNLQCLQESKT